MEVNAHSLFSKWFSESGKLVSRLFAKIMELVSPSSCAKHPPALISHRKQGETSFPLLGADDRIYLLLSAEVGWNVQVEEEGSLVCVLLDEVESLTRARSAAVSGSEPADAIRAVNSLLTQVCAWRLGPF